MANQLKYSDKIINYLKSNFSLKNNITRLIFGGIGIVLVLAFSLPFNLIIRSGGSIGTPTANPDIAFSISIFGTAGIFAVQSIICVVLFAVILFTTDWYLILLISIAFMGGLFNLFDRACSDFSLRIAATRPYVIDYINYGSSVGNVPDIAVIVGIIGYALFYVIKIIHSIVKSKETPEVKKDQTNEKPKE